MKRILAILLSAVFVLCACGPSPAVQWQEQYNLGVKYLSEGNFEEAAVAFTAAIEIDPNRADAYLGRGDTYMAMGATQENMALALADFEKALELLPGADVYARLADLYEALGNEEEAEKLREQGSGEESDAKPACEHQWAPANYQQPEMCLLCGDTRGEALPAALADGAFTVMEEGAAYDYTTLCQEDRSLTTTGRATVSDYRVLDSDETHAARDGYEWRTLTLTVTYDDDNAWNYGMQNRVNDVDYYTGRPFPQDEAREGVFYADYLGKEWECQGSAQVLQGQWEGQVFTWAVQFEYQVPVGYDGVAVILYPSSYNPDSALDFADICGEALADEGTLCFRLV